MQLNTIKLILTGALLALSMNSATAGTVFYSLSGLGGGAAQAPLDAVVDAGTSHTIYVYYTTVGGSELDTGISLDVNSGTTGVIGFTAAETLDFDITIATTDIGDRWGDFSGAAQGVNADDVTNLAAFTVVSGSGIVNANKNAPFTDEGWDSAIDAFLVGTIDFDALAPGITTLSTSPGANFNVHNGAVVTPTFLDGTITVIPEPTTAILGLFALPLALRRRRK
ncbi:MAG: hypothetical protein AAGA58_12360 [Verrucomicrobiota bacterium]